MRYKNIFWRRTWLLLLALATLSSLSYAAPGDEVFDDLQIHEIRFEFEQSDWYEDLEWSWENKQYIQGAVTVNGAFYDSVGVRFKGFSSYWAYPTDKKPFRIKFDKYKEYDWDGLQKVSLNNGWGDPTILKEKLHLDFLRRHDSDGPRGNFAKVFVNDTYWGFYSLVEHIDKTFLDDRIGNDDGNLYKADTDALLQWEGSNQASYYDNFALKTNEEENDWSDFISLVDKLNNTPIGELQDSLETVFNPSAHLLAWAVNNVTNNWDSYLDHGRNYYLYHNTTTGLFDWINWDVSLTLGGLGASSTRSLYHAPSGHPLHIRMLQIPEYRSEYITNVGNLVRDDFQNSSWDPRIDEIAAFIQADYFDDPRREFTNQQFIQGLQSLKNWINSRVNYIGNQIDIDLMDKIVINELMYNPATDPDVVEYVEIYNTQFLAQGIGNWSFADGLEFSFPPGTILPAGSYAVVTNDKTAFIALYGDLPLLFEWTSGSLSNGGERVAIADDDGLVIDEVSYDDADEWPTEPDGNGPSAELIHPALNNELGVSWLASNAGTAPTGTPGAQNSIFTSDGSAPVITSAAQSPAYVGLDYDYLVTASDADGDSLSFSLSVAPSFLAIDSVTGQMSGIPSSLDIGSHPLDIQVSDGNGGFGHQVFILNVVEPDPIYAVVINELQYNPAGDDSTEFIELVNTETFDVDMSGWVFNDGIEFTFPSGSIIAAGGYALVAYNSSALEAVYGVTVAYQWTDGRLANSGEILELSNATQILVDTVPYGDQNPWPEEPDGNGPSLELIATNLDNALPDSWVASEGQGTPGSHNSDTSGVDDDLAYNTPFATGLGSLYPNPFHGQIGIHFQLNQAGPVSVGVFDVAGRRVLSLFESVAAAGTHEVRWNGLDRTGRPAQPGVYFLRMTVGGALYSRQVVLLR